jgi:hypothetical protein
MDPVSIASTFLMHTGSRHLQMELTSGQKMLLSHPITKLCILGAMFYVSTRSILWSFVLIVMYVLTVNVLLNEKHSWNIFSRSWLQDHGFAADQKKLDMTNMYLENISKLA